jgi:hypothetical protein
MYRETTVDKNRLDELRQLVEHVMYASTKKEAQHSIRRLEFMASSVKGEIDRYFSDKLGEVISYAKEASGRVKNKDHWISCVDQCWYVFEDGVKEVNETKT